MKLQIAQNINFFEKIEGEVKRDIMSEAVAAAEVKEEKEREGKKEGDDGDDER